MVWGMLAPDTIVSQRRQQNLGLAAAVRHFNDRAVPGIGGMWFSLSILRPGPAGMIVLIT